MGRREHFDRRGCGRWPCSWAEAPVCVEGLCEGLQQHLMEAPEGVLGVK